MIQKRLIYISLFLILMMSLAACNQVPKNQDQSSLKVLAVESFLADIVQNVAGDRLEVETLMPEGLDPHAFEPTPKDVAKISDSDILFVNGAGLEEWLKDVVENLPDGHIMIEASSRLESRTSQAIEIGDTDNQDHEHDGEDHEHDGEEGHVHDHEFDPHFWLDPNLVITYVENIRDGLISLDPEGESVYVFNAEQYIQKLKELDVYIQDRIQVVPPERRLIVTNHESFGYFADRYGFMLVGTIIPSVSSGSSPSAQQLATLIDQMRAVGATAIFLETGSNPQLAEQLSTETGIKVIYDLYTHSVTKADGPAPTYIDLMKYNVDQMVRALAD